MDFSWASHFYNLTYTHPEYLLPVGAAIMAVLFYLKRPGAAIYVALIPLVNWSFANVPTIKMPDGGEWAPFAVVTGLVLIDPPYEAEGELARARRHRRNRATFRDRHGFVVAAAKGRRSAGSRRY